jgi:hypothetical protein
MQWADRNRRWARLEIGRASPTWHCDADQRSEADLNEPNLTRVGRRPWLAGQFLACNARTRFRRNPEVHDHSIQAC